MTMRRMVLLAIVGFMTPSWASEIYRWTDANGGLHFSNTPTIAGDRAGLEDEPAQPGTETGADATAGDEAAAYSTATSLRRHALEQELRTTERKLHDLDGRLGLLARARTRNAGENAAAGGVRSAATDLRSDEERALADEREALAKQAAGLRTEFAKLRDEVTEHLGGTTPEWWVEVR